VEYRERLACRYCGATHLKFMELSEVRYALRGVEDDVGGPVLVVDADPDHDPEGTSERLFCVSEGHELDQPDWLHRIWT
jgi:hypothetical protein